jgi:hypothetical protein
MEPERDAAFGVALPRSNAPERVEMSVSCVEGNLEVWLFIDEREWRGIMRRAKFAILMALVLVLASVGFASAQLPAYQTQFVTAITYQNVGTGEATVVFQFYNEGSATPVTITRQLPKGAGSSLKVDQLTNPGDAQLPTNFLGSAVMSSSQPVVATLVQLPQSSTVKNRPLSNGFSSVTSKVLLATVLKNQFSQTSKFSIQNADAGAADVKVTLVPVPGSGSNIALPPVTLPPGAAKYFDMGTLTQITGGSFNGSATVEAFKQGTTTPANIVGSVVEASTNGTGVSAFEGVAGGATTVYMPSALCNAFPNNLGGQVSNYAVQNTGTAAAAVTVTYAPSGKTQQATIPIGAKQSFNTCAAGVGDGYVGAATITSVGQPIVVIGKVSGQGLTTAFLGEPTGAAKLALPYVRYTNDASYNAGSSQRANIAIQNVGGAAVGPVTVQYLDKTGAVVGTHTIPSIAAGAKANSRSVLATGDAAKLLEFGTPAANPGGGFGGAAIVQGPAGSQLVAVVRIASAVPGVGQVAEDYNGIPVQ